MRSVVIGYIEYKVSELDYKCGAINADNTRANRGLLTPFLGSLFKRFDTGDIYKL